MIKIQLLPPYIVERRRVKALVALLIFVLIVEVLGFMAYLWAPAPFSLSSQRRAAEERRDKAFQAEQEVVALEAERDRIRGRYEAKGSWVRWVDEADAKPAEWVAYFTKLVDYFPADVVVNGLSLPSGNTLNLSGSTSGLMAAARWYLNMLRCDVVNTEFGQQAVQFNPGAVAAGSANPRMQMPVSISVALKPEFLDVMMPIARPAEIGGRGRSGGGRMGRGPGMGGGGARGGGGMRGGPRGGGGMRGGPRGGRF